MIALGKCVYFSVYFFSLQKCTCFLNVEVGHKEKVKGKGWLTQRYCALNGFKFVPNICVYLYSVTLFSELENGIVKTRLQGLVS